MTISVINNFKKYPDTSYEIQSIVRAGRDMGVPVSVSDLRSGADLPSALDALGEVVLFRTADVSGRAERQEVLLKVMQKRILVNRLLVEEPDIRFKDYQQSKLNEAGGVREIPTYRFASRRDLLGSLEKGEVAWPLIQKPRGGVKGKDVTLVRSRDDLVAEVDMKRFIYQPFIRNDGDYRILVVGGEVLGVMKRVAAVGAIANNLAQGGRGVHITDPVVTSELAEIIQRILEVFPLDMAGIDIIRSQDDGEFYFLEINLMPGWEGFEAVTRIDVGRSVVGMCQELYQSRS